LGTTLITSPEAAHEDRSRDTTATAPKKREVPSWRASVDPFSHPYLPRSLWSLATSVVPFVALWAAMYFSLQVSYLLTLVLAVPAAGFLLRTYILFHDCTHGSLFAARRANTWVGTTLGELFQTEDHREGVRAFLEKREAVYVGR